MVAKAPVTWQAPASLPHPRPHPPCRRRGPTRRPPPRTPRHWQASPPAPASRRRPMAEGQGKLSKPRQPSRVSALFPVPEPAPAALNATPGRTRRGPRHLFPRATVAAPRGRKQLRLCSSVPGPRQPPPTSGPAPPSRLPVPLPRPAGLVGAGPPGCVARAYRACALCRALTRAPGLAQDCPGTPARRAASHVPRRLAASRAPPPGAAQKMRRWPTAMQWWVEYWAGAPFPRPARPRRWLPPGGGPASAPPAGDGAPVPG